MIALAVLPVEVQAGAVVGEDVVLFELSTKGVKISVERDGKASEVLIPVAESAEPVVRDAIEVLKNGS